MNAKLRIKMGTVEVEYEGSDDFLKKELPALLKAVLELHASGRHESNEETEVTGGQAEPPRKSLSVSTFAAKLGAKSGSSLALAAAAALVIGSGKESFSRAELLRAMQGAKSYYKATYSNNLSAYISTLVKGQDLLDQGADSYSLHDAKRKELLKALA